MLADQKSLIHLATGGPFEPLRIAREYSAGEKNDRKSNVCKFIKKNVLLTFNFGSERSLCFFKRFAFPEQCRCSPPSGSGSESLLESLQQRNPENRECDEVVFLLECLNTTTRIQRRILLFNVCHWQRRKHRWIKSGSYGEHQVETVFSMVQSRRKLTGFPVASV